MTLLRVLMTATALATVVSPALAQTAVAPAPVEAPARPWMDTRLSPDERARLLVAAMTLEEQAHLMLGRTGYDVSVLAPNLPEVILESVRTLRALGFLGTAGFVPGEPRLGIPSLHLADATLGVANTGDMLRAGDQSTAFPSTLALASSFDPALARRAGQALGLEAFAHGFNVQLAGGVNLTREVRNGRNFEYVGEDPLLAGLIMGEHIAGVQDEHVVSTVKHYAVNLQETGRMVHDVQISEAAMRESDLLAFEIAIARGRPGSVMCAYNKVNGQYACENPFLLTEVLRRDWGYPGWVMSDWNATHSLAPAVLAGLDQESPQFPRHFSGMKAAVDSGALPASRVAESAQRILRSLFAVGVMDHPAAPGGPVDQAASAAIAEEIALSGIVLLKNDGVLPIAAEAKRILVVGGFADKGVLSGGGSSQVMPYGGHYADTRGLEGLETRTAPVYILSSPLEALRTLRPDAEIVFDDGSDPARAAAAARTADLALVFVSRPETEGKDSPDLSLPHGQDALIEAVASANPKTVAVLETGNPIAMPWLSRTAGVLQAWYPGQRGGQAIARILTGETSPSGRLPMSFPVSAEQTPRPELLAGENVVGTDASSIDHPFDLPINEGSDVGYRWFERSGQTPMFAFGHGLTYTTFDYGSPAFTGGDGLSVQVEITNTGSRDGVEVAQLYAAPPGRTHRLVGWARVPLKAGERRAVTIAADPRLLASWTEGGQGWVRTGGVYDVFVGRSAGAPESAGEVTLNRSSDVPRRIAGDPAS
ncbi:MULTISPECIES: glycoside hydrolase family 3 protein [unclassified Brevundimonas]|uniref:beta-glucosidase n=1 Tax=unclassified Brevundimonas TaxID=2622653 RepID=UPI000CFC4F94|nr:MULTISPECIES: beta-glucosidase [unclassified Brevundimonas]PRA27397.1 glycosyl hydrolase [Brevundimonas sp. MYb27]PQZ84550.1 glycosyl hydrolase [Brevundimonas sp. MYb31]PRB17786.1 glycosyl hydrolase [Brevundimonas sp. MYb52]PRB38156.1 glycosyl hydrolase [Brevundimonas sp. MYb46]PRB56061.1 glycosyl hydrolase [Brevundimonas sp. MYb33]